jgi:hypothetical protein
VSKSPQTNESGRWNAGNFDDIGGKKTSHGRVETGGPRRLQLQNNEKEAYLIAFGGAKPGRSKRP